MCMRLCMGWAVQANIRLRGGGLLVKGTPLAWEDSLQWLSYVREHGDAMRLEHLFLMLVFGMPKLVECERS
jgi:hypothetical protein